MPAAIPPKVGTTTPCRRMRGASRRPRRPAPPLVESHIATSARDSPLPEELACARIFDEGHGFRLSPLAGSGFRPLPKQGQRGEAGVRGGAGRGALPRRSALFDAAPHPRLLRRLAAFGSPLPASGERREALLFERLERSLKPLARRRGRRGVEAFSRSYGTGAKLAPLFCRQRLGDRYASWWFALAHRHPAADYPHPVLVRLSQLRRKTGV